MGHPDEGVILALLDGEPVEKREDLQAHLESCPQCRALAEAQGLQMRTLSGALSLLDCDPPMADARSRVLAAGRSMAEPRRKYRVPLPLAASRAVLITGGALSALPGSPVRSWVADQWGSSQAASPSETLALTGPGNQAAEADLAGATILPTADGMNLYIRGGSDGAEVIVRLVDGDQAGIFAGEGTRFRTEEGILEAVDPPGEVRVEIPRGITSVTLFVNGRVFLRQTSDGLEIQGPYETRTEDEIRFILPGG